MRAARYPAWGCAEVRHKELFKNTSQWLAQSPWGQKVQKMGANAFHVASCAHLVFDARCGGLVQTTPKHSKPIVSKKQLLLLLNVSSSKFLKILLA
jgi:hypothetical protein